MQIEKKSGNGPMDAFLLSVLPLLLAFAELLLSNPIAAQQTIPNRALLTPVATKL
jgi:hypothetical protein